MVRMLAFYSDDPSLSPAEAYSFSVKFVVFSILILHFSITHFFKWVSSGLFMFIFVLFKLAAVFPFCLFAVALFLLTSLSLSSFSISLFLFHLTCNGKKNKKRKTARASLFNGKKLFWNFFSKTSRLIVNHAPILDPTAVEFF